MDFVPQQITKEWMERENPRIDFGVGRRSVGKYDFEGPVWFAKDDPRGAEKLAYLIGRGFRVGTNTHDVKREEGRIASEIAVLKADQARLEKEKAAVGMLDSVQPAGPDPLTIAPETPSTESVKAAAKKRGRKSVSKSQLPDL
jgi:hypothetical protein